MVFGDVSSVAGHDRRFVMWPFYYKQHTTTSAQRIYSGIRVRCRFTISCARHTRFDDSAMAFFFSSIDDREKKYHEWHLPWLCSDRPGRGKTYHAFLSFYARRTAGTNVPPDASATTQESNFYLWPLYTYKRFHSDPVRPLSQPHFVFPLFRHHPEKYPEVISEEDFGLLTLTSATTTQHQTAGPFHPGTYLPAEQKHRAAILRRFIRFGGRRRILRRVVPAKSLLWNLYRHQTTPDSKRNSFLIRPLPIPNRFDGKKACACFIFQSLKHPPAARVAEPASRSLVRHSFCSEYAVGRAT